MGKRRNPQPTETQTTETQAVEDTQQTEVQSTEEQTVEATIEFAETQTTETATSDDALAAGSAVEENTVVEQPGAGKADEGDAAVVETEEGKVMNLNCVTILEYAKRMAPNTPNDRPTILRSQMQFYQAIMAILNNLEGAAFVEAYGQALEIMNEYSGTFTDNMVFRGMNEMRIPPAARQRFENIVVLMTSTADPQNRASALKAIDFSAFSKNFTADVEQKIRAFYK